MLLCNVEKPILKYSTAQFSLKNEDKLLIHAHLPLLPSVKNREDSDERWSVFVICDGHNGAEAPSFFVENIIDQLTQRLPKRCPSLKCFDSPDGEFFTWRVRKALYSSFRSIDDDWRKLGLASGCTATVVLTIGWLLTVANVGDSYAYLHCYGNKYKLSGNHRIDENPEEKERLESAGVFVAGVNLGNMPPERGEATMGPLRAWPGGLMMSRSIGDIDASSEVNACPHIKQVVIPGCGARLVLASDGLWDSLDARKVLSLTKTKEMDGLATWLIEKAKKVQGGKLTDDTTIIVVDILCTSASGVSISLPQHPEKRKGKNAVKALRKLVGVPSKVDHQLEFISALDSMEEFGGVPSIRRRTTIHDDHSIHQSPTSSRASMTTGLSRAGSSNNLDLIVESALNGSLKRLLSREMCQKSLLEDDSDTFTSLSLDLRLGESPKQLSNAQETP